MRRTPLLGAAAALCLLLGAAACGGDSDKTADELVDELTDVLQSEGQGGLDEDAARCYAEIIVDETGADALNDLDLSASEPPDELQDEITAAATRAVEECDLDGLSG